MGYATPPPKQPNHFVGEVYEGARNKELVGPWEGLARHHRKPPGWTSLVLEEEWAMGRDPPTPDCLLACGLGYLRS